MLPDSPPHEDSWAELGSNYLHGPKCAARKVLGLRKTRIGLLAIPKHCQIWTGEWGDRELKTIAGLDRVHRGNWLHKGSRRCWAELGSNYLRSHESVGGIVTP